MDRETSGLGDRQDPDVALRLLTSSEVANILAVSERTLWKLTKSGDIPCVHIGRSVRYDARSLDLWIRARESSRSKTTSGTTRRRVDGEHHSRTKWA